MRRERRRSAVRIALKRARATALPQSPGLWSSLATRPACRRLVLGWRLGRRRVPLSGRHMRRRQRCQRNAERLQLREAVRGADLAGRDRANRAAVDEGRLIAQGETLRRVALQADIQAGQRQCHAAAAAELAAFHPGRQPLAADVQPDTPRLPDADRRSGQGRTPQSIAGCRACPANARTGRRHRRPAVRGRARRAFRPAPPPHAGRLRLAADGRRGRRGASLVRRSTCSRGAWSVLWRD